MSEYSLEIIEKRLKELLTNELTRSGLLFRLHSRIKDRPSIEEKFSRKNYSSKGTLMQDLFGFRIITYFNDDVKVVVQLCDKIFEKIELIYDQPELDVFKPLRKNMICKLPKDLGQTFSDLQKTTTQYEFVDDTFEIQFRTTFSEGWHEVDHLMRYKCKPDWMDLNTESRMLNGIYATLETNDQALNSLFEDISYQHYKKRNWEAMIRNKFRLKFLLKPLDISIVKYLDENDEIGKKIFKLNRSKVLDIYINSTLSFPITFNTYIYFLNYIYIKDEFITNNTPEIFINELKLSL